MPSKPSNKQVSFSVENFDTSKRQPTLLISSENKSEVVELYQHLQTALKSGSFAQQLILDKAKGIIRILPSKGVGHSGCYISNRDGLAVNFGSEAAREVFLAHFPGLKEQNNTQAPDFATGMNAFYFYGEVAVGPYSRFIEPAMETRHLWPYDQSTDATFQTSYSLIPMEQNAQIMAQYSTDEPTDSTPIWSNIGGGIYTTIKPVVVQEEKSAELMPESSNTTIPSMHILGGFIAALGISSIALSVAILSMGLAPVVGASIASAIASTGLGANGVAAGLATIGAASTYFGLSFFKAEPKVEEETKDELASEASMKI